MLLVLKRQTGSDWAGDLIKTQTELILNEKTMGASGMSITPKGFYNR